MTQNVLITGANGFVGQAASRLFLQRGDGVTGLVRRPGATSPGVREWLLESSNFVEIERHWPSAFSPDAVVHLAARVHLMRDTSGDPLRAYRETNVEGTLRVAKAARNAGARRFVFVSSVKATAERDPGRPLMESDTPNPVDPYGVSKLEAERALLAFAKESELEVVIVRPPLVYGPGVRANFLQLMHAVSRGIPLPLAAITAQRSLIFVDNLADAIVKCATDARAAGETFHVTDRHDLSVAQLTRMLAMQLHAPSRLVSVPAGVLRMLGKVSGKSAQVDRLIGELRLDSSHIARTLDWYPPHTVEHGLLETAAWYRSIR